MKLFKLNNEKLMTPVSLSGVLVPWTKTIAGQRSDYKLTCSSGLEYFIVSAPEWQDVLSRYSWEEVKVIGLLNIANMTVIPQKIFPRGPTGEKENTVDIAAWKKHKLTKKLVNNLNELVLIPAAICALMV